MGDLSRNFSKWEFACKCGCGFDSIDLELIEVLQKVADKFGKPVHVNSGCRCHNYNAKVGGVPSSQHILGKAADINIPGIFPDQIKKYVETIMPAGGIGLYPSFIHIDVRKNKARWKG